MKSCVLLLFSLLGWAGSVCAQTTQPAPPAWVQMVQSLGKALAAGNECQPFVADDCVVRSFDSATARQMGDVSAHASGATLLLAKAYLFPGGAIAGDIGAAVQDSRVSDDLKRMLVPAEGDPTTKANATATRWLQGALAPASGDPVAVLVFFTGDQSQTVAADGQVLFVMLKGRTRSNGGYVVNQIVYGDSQQAEMTAGR